MFQSTNPSLSVHKSYLLDHQRQVQVTQRRRYVSTFSRDRYQLWLPTRSPGAAFNQTHDKVKHNGKQRVETEIKENPYLNENPARGSVKSILDDASPLAIRSM